MTEQRPNPLVPAEADLRDFQFMPVDVQRLLTSETWVLGDGDQRAAAITLWLASWHQVPAGSLPGNNQMLAHLSQSKRWAKVKEHALRGWIECADGRLYHPVVCEKVLEAWIEKLGASLSGAAGNAKRWNVEIDITRIRQQAVHAVELLEALAPRSKTLKKKVAVLIKAGSRGESPPDGTPGSPPESHPDSPPESGPESPPDRKGQGQGQGQGLEEITPQPPTGGRRATSDPPEGFDAFWAVCPRREGKATAMKAWAKLAPDAELQGRILAAMVLQARTDAWTREGGRFIPHPTTWLNQRRWEDEVAAPEPGPAPAARPMTVAELADRDPHPAWLEPTGFGNLFEAENAGCYPHTAHRFRDGKRVAA